MFAREGAAAVPALRLPSREVFRVLMAFEATLLASIIPASEFFCVVPSKGLAQRSDSAVNAQTCWRPEV